MLPSTSIEACQFLVELGMEYKQIHSYNNDFILYKDEYQDKVQCVVCKDKRYCIDVQGPIVPNKVLCYMPIIPQLQQIFCFKSLAQLMD